VTPTPTIVQKRALDVTPYLHGVWCSVGGSAPFVNPIVLRSWSEDGSTLQFMLDSHNFLFTDPETIIDVVEMTPDAHTQRDLSRILRDDAKTIARRPYSLGRVLQVVEHG
jgi:hypothetical protein